MIFWVFKEEKRKLSDAFDSLSILSLILLIIILLILEIITEIDECQIIVVFSYAILANL